jgi:putative ABC transport system permease protein
MKKINKTINAGFNYDYMNDTIFFYAKDRKYEIGVLLSLGETKSKIVTQLLAELIIIATIAMTISLGTSSIVSNQLGESLLENQIEMSEEQSEDNFGRGMGMIQSQTSTSDVEVIDELNINAQATDYIILYALGYLIIIGSLIIPIMQILKYEPKTILTGREN